MGKILSHSARDAWILAISIIFWIIRRVVASRKGCVDSSTPGSHLFPNIQGNRRHLLSWLYSHLDLPPHCHLTSSLYKWYDCCTDVTGICSTGFRRMKQHISRIDINTAGAISFYSFHWVCYRISSKCVDSSWDTSKIIRCLLCMLCQRSEHTYFSISRFSQNVWISASTRLLRLSNAK